MQYEKMGIEREPRRLILEGSCLIGFLPESLPSELLGLAESSAKA